MLYQPKIWRVWEKVPEDIQKRLACDNPQDPKIEFFWTQGEQDQHVGVQYKNPPSSSPTPSLDLWESVG